MYAQDYILQNFHKVKLRSDKTYYDACCPLHQDNSPSLSIDALTGRCTCHQCGFGGWLDDMAKQAGLPEPPRKEGAPTGRQDKPAQNKRKPKSPTVAEYIYTDGNAKNHMRIVRTAAKDFFQYRWSGVTWIAGIKGPDGPIDRLPYNLARIAQSSSDQFIIWVEGEKDADLLNSLGLLATTSPGGAKAAGKLARWDMFKARRVFIVPDNDEPGKQYARTVAKQLLEAGAAEVKICELPNLPAKGDVSDWIGGGRSIGDFKAALMEHSAEFTVAAVKPDIQLDWRDVRDTADEVLSHMLGLGELFNRGGELVHLVRRDGQDPPQLKALDKDGLLSFLCRHMSFYTSTKNGPKACAPPAWLAGLVQDSIMRFPTARRVTELPFINKEGDLVTREGLDAGTGTYLLPLYPGLDIPSNPTKEQAERDAKWLGHDFLGDFPFAEEFHRTHTISALIQPFVAAFIDDQMPLTAISATTMGTGKTRLGRTLAYVFDANGADLVTESQNPQHFESAVFSVLRGAPSCILLDNVKSDLDHVWLQGLLSTPKMQYRILGTNNVISVRNPPLWLVTANNPTWNSETRRRTNPIELDPQMESPWSRRAGDFKIPDIERFAQAQRPEILKRIYTVLQYWRSQGCPLSDDFSGSFERWARVMGGILAGAGLEGFLKHLSDEHADLDHEVIEWRALLDYWFGRLSTKGRWITPRLVAEMAQDQELLLDVIGDKSPGQQSSAMGRALTKKKGRVFGDFRVLRRKGGKGYEYSVERIDRDEPSGPDAGGGPPRPGGGVSPPSPISDLSDHVPTIESTWSEPQTPADTGVAAGLRPCRPFSPVHAHACTELPPEASQNKVGMVGKVGDGLGKERKLGEIRGKLPEKTLKSIQMALLTRRSSYAARGGDFGVENPRWPAYIRPMIESGTWIPPADMPWDSTLAIDPPPGWVFLGDQAASGSAKPSNSSEIPNTSPHAREPSRASPPEEEKSLSECLDQILL